MLVGAATVMHYIRHLGRRPGSRRRTGFINNFLRWFSFLGLSMPNFWIAMLFILIFSVKLQILPTGGYGPSGTS